MDIKYADNDILVCVKPSGVLSTDEPGGMPSLLREALGNPSAEIYTVHRLDRVVGGLMVFARTSSAAAELSRQVSDRSFRKEYLAVVHGEPDPEEGTMEDLLFRDSAENKTYVVKRMRKGVRQAALEYKVLKKEDGFSLVSIHLLTGRTHQIRAQFSSRSMPLAGDRKYGSAADSCETALWSSRLCFKHPRTGKKMDFSLEPSGGYPWSLFGYEGEPLPSFRQIPSPPSVRDYSCPVSARCGGCQLLELSYAEQLRRKQEKLHFLLGKYGTVEPIIGMEHPYHYRNKVQFALGYDKKGHAVIGNYQASSHRIVTEENCLINDETANRIASDIFSMLPEFHIAPYDEKRGTGFLRHILIKRGFTTGEVMVVLVVTSSSFPLQKPFLKSLLKKHPEIKTVLLNINSRFTPVVLGREEKVLYGSGSIEDVLCGYRFRISARSFYQVNPVQTEKLYETAISFAGLTGKESVLDAYCGTGTIGICASSVCRSVTGVELNKDAVQDAILNAKTNSIKNIWFVCGDAGSWIAKEASEKRRFDLVFMDPPRAGSSKEFLSSLLYMKPPRIVYISCGPDTLARDLEILTNGGYHVERIQPVDMFPHTDHVETVVQLSKGEISTKKIRVEFSLEDMDISDFQQGATCQLPTT